MLLLSKFEYPCQQIRQAVSHEHHPSMSNPPRTNNVSHGKHGSRCNHRAVLISTPRNPNPSAVTVSNLCRNLEALFGPRLKAGARKFGELGPLKFLAVSECRSLVL